MRSWNRGFAAAVIAGVASGFVVAPALAQNVTLNNIVVGSGPIQMKVPQIEFEGISLSQAELAGMFDASQIGQLADRLRRLNARVVRIPEINMEQTIGAGATAIKQDIRYGGIAFTDISGGRARHLRMAPSSASWTDPLMGPMSMQIGAIASDDVDLAFLASFFTEPSVSVDQSKRVIYRNFVMDGIGMTMGAAGTMRLGKMTVGEIRMRPLKTSFADLLQMLGGQQPGQPPSGEVLRKLLAFYADFFEAYDTTASEIAGMEFNIVDKKTNQPINFSIARMTGAPFADGVMQGFSMENLKVGIPDGRFSLGAFGLKAIDFRPFVAAMGKMGSSPPEQYLMANWRDVIPNMSGFYFTGFDLDVPDEKKPGQRIAMSFGQLDLALAKHVLGIPTDIGLSIKDLALDLAKLNNPDFAPALAIGYTIFKASSATRLLWDEASKTIRLSDRISVDQVADYALDGTVANVPSELFGKDLSLMQVAALGLTVRDAKLTLSNKGVYERVLGLLAQQQRSTPDALRQQYGGIAMGMIPQMLGGSPAVVALGQAVGRFAQNGKSITVVATSKNPNGVGLPEAMSIKSPQDLLERIELQATAD